MLYGHATNGLWHHPRIRAPTDGRLGQYPILDRLSGLFSRSAIVDSALERKPERPKPHAFEVDKFQPLINQFWFKGTLSVTKVMRNDLLIGLHLALDMVRDCLVLAMLLRDRAEGTNHHRTGGAYNSVVNQLYASHAYTSMTILDIVEQSSITFDKLAAQMSSSYKDQRQPLIEWVEYARRQHHATN